MSASPIRYRGECFDSALGDPIPVEKAFELGCDRMVLILTKPERVLRTPGKDELFARGIQRKYPAAAEKLRQRARRYNEGVALAQEYAKKGQGSHGTPLCEGLCGRQENNGLFQHRKRSCMQKIRTMTDAMGHLSVLGIFQIAEKAATELMGELNLGSITP